LHTVLLSVGGWLPVRCSEACSKGFIESRADTAKAEPGAAVDAWCVCGASGVRACLAAAAPRDYETSLPRGWSCVAVEQHTRCAHSWRAAARGVCQPGRVHTQTNYKLTTMQQLNEKVGGKQLRLR
jgi:hypothetical protein